jgi:hypothetical protein
MLLTLFQNNAHAITQVTGVGVTSASTVSGVTSVHHRVSTSLADTASVAVHAAVKRGQHLLVSDASSISAHAVVKKSMHTTVASTGLTSSSVVDHRRVTGVSVSSVSLVTPTQLKRLKLATISPITTNSSVSGASYRHLKVSGSAITASSSVNAAASVKRQVSATLSDTTSVHGAINLKRKVSALVLDTSSVTSHTKKVSSVKAATINASTLVVGAGKLYKYVSTTVHTSTSVSALYHENRKDTIQPIISATSVTASIVVHKAGVVSVQDHSHVVASDVASKHGVVATIASSSAVNTHASGKKHGVIAPITSIGSITSSAGYRTLFSVAPITVTEIVTTAIHRRLVLLPDVISSGTLITSASVMKLSGDVVVNQPTVVSGRSVLKLTMNSYVGIVAEVSDPLAKVLRSVGVHITNNTTVSSLVKNLRGMTSSPITASSSVSDVTYSRTRGMNAVITGETTVTGRIGVIRYGNVTVNVDTDLTINANKMATVLARIDDVITTQYEYVIKKTTGGAVIDAVVGIDATASNNGLHADFTMTIVGQSSSSNGPRVYLNQSIVTNYTVSNRGSTTVMFPQPGEFTVRLDLLE